MQSWSIEFLEISYAWEPEIIWFSFIFSLNSSAVGHSATVPSLGLEINSLHPETHLED